MAYQKHIDTRKNLVQCALIALMTLMTAPTWSDQITISLNNQQSALEVSPELLETDAQGGVAKFEVASDQSFMSESGQPQIPFQIIRLLLDPDSDLDTISVQFQADYTELDGTWSVSPMPPLATRDEDGREILVWPALANIVDGYDTDIYETDALWPTTDAQLINSGQLRGWKIAEISIPLFRYNPISGKLLELTGGTLEVTTESISSPQVVSVKSVSKTVSTPDNTLCAERVKELTVNYTQAVADYSVTNSSNKVTLASSTLTKTGYVIITTNDIVNTSSMLADFVSHKEDNYTVTVITEDDYGEGTGETAASNIRTWLQNNYTNSTYGDGGILYVLLIGNPSTDSDSVPMKLCLDEYPTDYFYAELSSDWDADGDGIYGEGEDTTDKYFEVYTGRIPYYGTISDTDNILQKVIDYESNEDVNWRRNVLLPMAPLDESTQAYQLGEEIKYNLLETKAIPSTRIYSRNYSLLPAPEYILDNRYPGTEWSENIYGMIVWLTHGSQTKASYVMSTSNVSDLNDDYPSTVFLGSCQNGYPENSGNLAYSILKNGGIGTVAASRNGWYWVGQTSFTSTNSVGGLAYQYAKNIANKKTTGQAIWDGKESVNFWNKNYYAYNIYGDPSVTVMPSIPNFTITPTHGPYFSYPETQVRTDSQKLTLKNTGSASTIWTATTGNADWYDLSAYQGVLNSSSITTVTVSLNTKAQTLPVGKYQDAITFYDSTNDITTQQIVTLYVVAKEKIAHWPMDETSGTTASDITGNEHNGTVANTSFDSASTTGMLNSALEFNGSEDYIEVDKFTEDITAMTISVWIKSDNWDSNRRILQKGSDSCEYRLLAENDAFVFEVGSTRLDVSDLPETDSWVYITAVYDGTALQMYYNGVLKDSVNCTGNVPTCLNNLYIGTKSSSTATGDFFDGVMDDLRIYNYAMDADTVVKLYNGADPVEIVSPANNASSVALVTDLKWTMGYSMISANVYFGTNYDSVFNATIDSTMYQGCQSNEIFELDMLNRNTTYYWRIDQIDESGNIFTGPIWKFTTGDGSGSITRQVWTGLDSGDVTINDLTDSDNYPDNPSLETILDTFEIPSNWSDGYGTRVYGFLVPPVSGDYQFWISGDDEVELWLSTDKTLHNAELIAYMHNTCSEKENFDKYDSQESSLVILEAGTPYYIMALHKEASGDDHMAVAFSGPGFDRQIIDGKYLMAYADNYNWGPFFTSTSLYGVNAVEGCAYSDSVAGTATAMDGGDVFYAKVAGPLWLQVASDGTLSGIPGNGDAESNNFEIRATDSNGSSNLIPLYIDVDDTATGELGLPDFAELATQWLNQNCNDSICGGSDLTDDASVDIDDLLAMSSMWLVENTYGKLIAKWPFDTDADDMISGYAGNFMGNASTTQEDGKFTIGSGALSLDGEGDYVETNFKGITGNAPRTCCAWIKTNDSGEILTWGTAANGQKWVMRMHESGGLRIEVQAGHVTGTTTVNDGTWHHVAVVSNGEDIYDAQLYIDGQLETSLLTHIAQTINTAVTDEEQYVRIGCHYATERYFNGLIDDLRIYDRALTTKEIAKIIQ